MGRERPPAEAVRVLLARLMEGNPNPEAYAARLRNRPQALEWIAPLVDPSGTLSSDESALWAVRVHEILSDEEEWQRCRHTYLTRDELYPLEAKNAELERLEADPLQGVVDDYRTLLADGVVGFTRARTWRVYDRDLRQWQSELTALAEADGLRAELSWMHNDDVEFWPLLELTRRDGERMPGPNIVPYNQQAAAAWHRPRAEAEWGKVLAAARERAGPHDPEERAKPT